MKRAAFAPDLRDLQQLRGRARKDTSFDGTAVV
jgi:hypothetical protein